VSPPFVSLRTRPSVLFLGCDLSLLPGSSPARSLFPQPLCFESVYRIGLWEVKSLPIRAANFAPESPPSRHMKRFCARGCFLSVLPPHPDFAVPPPFLISVFLRPRGHSYVFFFPIQAAGHGCFFERSEKFRSPPPSVFTACSVFRFYFLFYRYSRARRSPPLGREIHLFRAGWPRLFVPFQSSSGIPHRSRSKLLSNCFF